MFGTGRRGVQAIVLAAAVLPVAACGGSGGDAAKRPDPGAEQQRWVHEVDTACS
jgi:hypothetical protein